jgi:hypothetical protein
MVLVEQKLVMELIPFFQLYQPPVVVEVVEHISPREVLVMVGLVVVLRIVNRQLEQAMLEGIHHQKEIMVD